MSITDDVRPGAGSSAGPPDDSGPGGGGGGGYDRTPPQDVAAEQCVLGGMLLSKDAIADVVEILKGNDFYRPMHATIFDAILDLYGRGEPADPITVAAALADSGDLARIGGAPYLHTLMASVPTAANAAYYARIVGERAVLRRLVEAGTRIVQLGYGSGSGGGRDVDDVVDLAQQAVYDVTERRVSEDFAILADMLQPTLDEIEAVGAQGGVMTGVPTGFTDLDRLLNGLHPGQLIIVAGRPGLGKCLAADARVTDAYSGRAMSIAEFVGRGRAGERLAVHTVTADDRIKVVEPSDFVPNGAKPVFRLVTRSGRAVRATANHPFRAGDGWRELSLLRPGDKLAIADPPGIGWDVVAGIEPDGEDQVYDLTVDGTHNFIANGIVVHNSTAAMDFARSASVRHNLASAIFSLEMSKVEIVMRLLAAEARVPLHVLRSGQLSDDDWTKLARRMGEISEAPLFVDDTPSMNLMEIRAKARRLRQRHDLKLIVVDYLQLMTSPKRTESRQQEVADLSRGLKLLAKEVECPVIAVSQLNRGPEQRTDKRPQLSDLRESGCMTEDTTLLRADTGAPVSFGELLRDGHENTLVWSVDEHRKMVAAPLTAVFPSGEKPTYRLVLSSGRRVKASGNHPFLTRDGWRRLDELAVGGGVAVPRRIPEPARTLPWPNAEIVRLAHRLGGRLPDGRDPCGPRPAERFVPDGVFSLPKRQVAEFLRHLWATGGAIGVPGDSAATACYPSTSRRLADDVLTLLARFGIVARVETAGESGCQVVIADPPSLITFCREIGVPGTHGHATDELPAAIADRSSRPAEGLDSGPLPTVVDDDVYWDSVVAVEPLGVQPVFDATVAGTHNFVADGILAHNSIEQDADVVILLHRDDYYDKESPRAGEADFIVAKHRNGPTDTVTVAAQLHLSRFVDMAIV